MDLDREADVEQLRRIARTQQVQIEQLVKVLASQSRRIDELTGGDGELQQALALVQKLQHDAGEGDDSGDDAGAEGDARADDSQAEQRKPRQGHGPKPQPQLEVQEQLFELGDSDRTCPSCGG